MSDRPCSSFPDGPPPPPGTDPFPTVDMDHDEVPPSLSADPPLELDFAAMRNRAMAGSVTRGDVLDLLDEVAKLQDRLMKSRRESNFWRAEARRLAIGPRRQLTGSRTAFAISVVFALCILAVGVAGTAWAIDQLWPW